MDKIEYSEISVSKITKNVYRASCNVVGPVKISLTMDGKTAEIASEKLRLFLDEKPYKHLDN